ncbi:PH domain-containing protein [Spongiactinospora sp. 9N601]|uniref:PH domain-containing protein n=1 Tax=Spongiactinospora sp. 9N601 TaxID=3375149 RepID=UPI003797BEFA
MDLRPPRNRADRRAVTWWTVQGLIGVLVAAVAVGVPYVLFTDRPLWPAAVAAGFVVALLALALVWPRAYYRFSRWEVTDEAVYTCSGWLFRSWRIAPMSRIQTVDTVRGPLQRLFGLSDVTVTTASSAGAIKIEGLDHALAAGLVERLTEITQRTPGDAT